MPETLLSESCLSRKGYIPVPASVAISGRKLLAANSLGDGGGGDSPTDEPGSFYYGGSDDNIKRGGLPNGIGHKVRSIAKRNAIEESVLKSVKDHIPWVGRIFGNSNGSVALSSQLHRRIAHAMCRGNRLVGFVQQGARDTILASKGMSADRSPGGKRKIHKPCAGGRSH